MKRPREEGEVDVNLARLLMLLSSSAAEAAALQQHHHPQPNRVFECKTCSRQFSSFQALGGHRASHKKPRLSDDPAAPGPARPAKPRVHECSICGLEFSLGQALGGHMRRHRALLAGARAAPSEDAGKMRIEEEDDDAEVDGAVAFDLNMPPLENDPLLTFTLGLPLVLDAVACAARD